MRNRYERLNQERKYVYAKRKVAAYCRVSTDNEDQANSFESQQRYFRQYIERNSDWELYEIFADEFTAARSNCDKEIAELQSVIDSIDKQHQMIEQQQQLIKEIEDAVGEIVGGVEYEDDFYKHILDKMMVIDKDNIDVYLNLLPIKWSYTVAKASKKTVASEMFLLRLLVFL